MHDDIKSFPLEGDISPELFVSARESLIEQVESRMREDGFVPVLDLTPQMTREYDESADKFVFKLTVYGVYVGETSWEVAGVTNGKKIMKYTPQSR